MSLLQKFLIMFESNAKDATKDVKDLEQAADKTADKMDDIGKKSRPSFREAQNNARNLKQEMLSTDAVAGKLGTSFMNLAKGLAGGFVAGLSVNALVGIAKARAEEIDAMDKLATRVSSGIGDVDAFGRASRLLNGEIDTAQSSLISFNDKINEAFSNTKSKAAKAFQNLGVNIKDTNGQAKGAMQVLLDLAGASEKMNKATALGNIKKLGITDQGAVALIMSGRKEMQKYLDTQKELGVVTEEQRRIVAEYNDEMDLLGDTQKAIGNQITAFVLPVLTQLSKAYRWLAGWLSDNRTLVEGFFVGVAAVITAVYLPAVLSALAATVALLAPYIAIAAAVLAVGAAFALAYEDVMFFLNGQPSLLGQLVEKYESVAAVVRGIGIAFTAAKELWDTFVASVERGINQDFSGLLADIEKIGAAFKVVWDGVLAGFNAIIGPIKAGIEGIVSAISGAFNWLTRMGGMTNLGLGIPASATGPNGGPTLDEVERIRRTYQGGPEKLGMYGSPAGVTAAAGGANVTQTKSQQINVGGVTVNTQATDAEGVANGVTSALNNQLRQTTNSFDDGVDK